MQTKEQVVELEISSLLASESNRAVEVNGGLNELSENIKVEGVLVPLIVRIVKAGNADRHEIVAGHRRWTAAGMAGLEKVPCIVRVLDDAGAKRTQIIENLHRKNLNPMEEAHAFNSLAHGETSVQTISELVGKDVKYVYRALALLQLPSAAQKAIEGGKLTAAHGHQLVRVGGKQFESVLKYALTPDYHHNHPTVEDLKNFIRQRVGKRLSAAPWDKNVTYAGKVACKGCPNNSSNQDSLFDEAEDGQCTNGTCFNTKLMQFYKDLRDKGQAKWPFLKFIGTATTRYGNTQTIKGYTVVEETSMPMRKAFEAAREQIKKSPDLKVAGAGFGILKPSNWGTLKAAKLVVLKLGVSKDIQEKGYERDPDEMYHWQFLREYDEVNGKAVHILENKAEQLRVQVHREGEALWKKNKVRIIAEYKKLEEAKRGKK